MAYLDDLGDHIVYLGTYLTPDCCLRYIINSDDPDWMTRVLEFEAKQWYSSGSQKMFEDSVFFEHESDRFYVITIHEQRAYLLDGDWIITEPDGSHHYPCKPDIFEATYESEEIIIPKGVTISPEELEAEMSRTGING